MSWLWAAARSRIAAVDRVEVGDGRPRRPRRPRGARPGRAAVSNWVMKSAVEMRVLLGTQSVSTAGAAEAVAVDDGDRGAEVGGDEGGLVAARAATEDDDLDVWRQLTRAIQPLRATGSPIRGTAVARPATFRSACRTQMLCSLPVGGPVHACRHGHLGSRRPPGGPRDRHSIDQVVQAPSPAASLAAAVAACSPPSKTPRLRRLGRTRRQGRARRPPPPPSAGWTRLVAAAKKEGTLNVIALPPDWANYGEVIKGFQAKYEHQGRPAPSPTPPAPTRSPRPPASRASPSAPDVFDLGAAVALANTEHVRAVQGRRRSATSPTNFKDAERHVGQRLRRLHVHRLRLAKVPAPTTVADLLKPALQGQGRPERRPDQGRRGLQRGRDGRDRQRWLRRRHHQGRRLLRAAEGRPATSCRSTRRRPRSSPARRRSSSTGTTSTPRRRAKLKADAGRRSSRTNAVVAGYYVQAINKDAPHPAAARLWQEFLYSDEGQNLWLKGGARPVR